MRSSESGFTLVEILMVVFIVGLASSLIVMSLPERNTGLQEDAALLQRDVHELADLAVLTGVPHAVEFDNAAYQGVLWQAGEWVSLGAFGRELSSAVLVDSEEKQPRDEELLRIVFDPSGVPTQAYIELGAGGEQIAISLNRDIAEAG